jgi:hypothetical protein
MSPVGIVEKKGMYKRNAHVHKTILGMVDAAVELAVEAVVVGEVKDMDAMADMADNLEDKETIMVEEDLVMAVEEVNSKVVVAEWLIL